MARTHWRTRRCVLGAVFLLTAIAIAQAAESEGAGRLVIVGDVMLAESEGTGRFLASGGDPFAGVRKMLADADLRVANFESSAGTTGKADPDKPYSFRTRQAALPAYAALFEATSLANNHAGDFGRQELLETRAALEKAGSRTFGAGATPGEAHKAAIIERKGVKIALLGYLDFFPRWFSVAPSLPGVAWLDEQQAALDIAAARADGADIVIVIPHWGVEFEPRASDRQRRLARALLDAGAHAVIGGHPHVVQDFEVYKGKPIIYSVGNFVFDGFDDEDSLTGWAVFADFDRQGIAAISTRAVRIDTHGSPAPHPNRDGPCWKRGTPEMVPCARARGS